MKLLFVTTDKYPNFGATSNIIRKLIVNGKMIDDCEKIGVLTTCEYLGQSTYEVIDGVEIFRADDVAFIPWKSIKNNISIMNIGNCLKWLGVKGTLCITEKFTFN